ncbi:MAG TPA: hypothetical protein ENN12_04655 [Epsilonproteobacteria bacterium]|nr:hypothetical protein [Campylobacterota bacterium]
MQKLLAWTLQSIRDEESDFSWMEEKRYDWTPLIKSVLERIVQGQSVLILTDPPRRWFGHYIQNKINATINNRPFLPFYQMTRMFSMLEDIQSAQDLALLEDMLDISFSNGYFIWYIGEGTHPFTKLVYRNEENFLWILDDQVQNSFFLKGSDPLLDLKLIQLYKLFDSTITAVLFGELELES